MMLDDSYTAQSYELCPICKVRLVDCEWDGVHPDDPIVEASDQICGAMNALDIHADRYLGWPWPAIDALVGWMAPGTVHYAVAYSGLGKTTFVSSAIYAWQLQGKKIDVLPLELSAETYRTYMACVALGISPGLMLSGEFLKLPKADELRKRVHAELTAQLHNDAVRVRGWSEISVREFRTAVSDAARRGADVVVVDHIDHVKPSASGKTSFQVSEEVNRAALSFAREFNVCLLLTSQANAENIRISPDHLAKYAPLKDSGVWMGGVKRQVCTTMVCLYRPLRGPRPGESEKDFKTALTAARSGENPQDMLIPATTRVQVMKHRNDGSREGKSAPLTLRDGRFINHDPMPGSML